MSALKKRKLSESLKKVIASEQEWKCKSCQDTLPPSYQVDHIIPHSISQNDNKDNLVALCANCHSVKTQTELKRITSFKKLMKFSPDCDLCWWCLQSYQDTHVCNSVDRDSGNYILRDIDLVLKKYKAAVNTFDEICNRYSYIPAIMKEEEGIDVSKMCSKMTKKLNGNEEISKDMEKLEINTEKILEIKIDNDCITVGSFFTKLDNSTNPSSIAEAVKIATNPKRDVKYGKYTRVKILLNINRQDLEGSEECANYILELLPGLLDPKLFKNVDDVDYEIEI
jgi:hypothetical protein